MGVSYFIAELNSLSADTIAELGKRLPPVLPSSRMPTLSELKRVVSELQEFNTTSRISPCSKSVDFEIVHLGGYDAGLSTRIWAHRASDRAKLPGPSDPVSVMFHKGDPELALEIVHALTHLCGPLVFIMDCDVRPILIRPDTDLQRALRDLVDPENSYEWASQPKRSPNPDLPN